MSREIKFRVWDVLEKRYTSNEKNYYLMQDGFLWRWLNSFDGETHLQGLPKNLFILEQYTGLKDKNGKEIYEGDIVKFSTASERFVKGPTVPFTVIYNRTAFRLKGRDGAIGAPISVIEPLEVIGTIHENPELLEGEK